MFAIYYEIAYGFLLENPYTLFYKLPLEIIALIMQKQNQLKFKWHDESARTILYQHYGSLIPCKMQNVVIMDWRLSWISHDFPKFVASCETESLNVDNDTTLFLKEIVIRKKRGFSDFWRIKSKSKEKLLHKNKLFKKKLIDGQFVWRN
jgi:hypothetical protein